jgi:hypothetical protein
MPAHSSNPLADGASGLPVADTAHQPAIGVTHQLLQSLVQSSGEVLLLSGGEVVQDRDSMATLEQGVNEV